MIDFRTLDYKKYCLENDIHKLPLIEISIESYGIINEKKVEKWATIDPENKIPLPPELDDLVRLHYLVRNRKVRTILEFGGGKSTSVFSDALQKTKINMSKWSRKN